MTSLPSLTIGLTGGIGSGKSTAASLLIEHGAVLVDTDAISRELTAPGGAALPALAAEFGVEIISVDGALDRRRMREMAFDDPHVRARLEAVLHPMIGKATHAAAAAAAGQTVVFDVPLLTESAQWRARVDRVLVIDCTEATQVRRVMQRNGWTEDAVRQVMASQAARPERRAIADAIVFNEGLTLDMLRDELNVVWTAWHD